MTINELIKVALALLVYAACIGTVCAVAAYKIKQLSDGGEND